VHAGIAIERLDADEAEETRRLFAEMFGGDSERTAES